MVFHMSTIGINGFSNGFSIRDNGYSMFFYRWTIGINGLSNGLSIRHNVFPMVSYSGNIGLNGLEKASDGHQWFTEKRLFIVNMAPVSEI